ncbi:MAG: hypothetical protein OHK0012_27430 [Synechococcales cyanobacterium]
MRDSVTTVFLSDFQPRLSPWRWHLDRYLLGQMLRPVLAGLGGGTLLVTAGKLFPLAERLVVERVSPGIVAQLLVLDLPATMVLALPIAGMFATLLTLGSLTSNSEITALRSSGISWRRIFIPVLVMGLLLSGLSFAVNNTLVPVSRSRIRELDQRALITQFATNPNQDLFFKADDQYWFFIRTVNPALNRMQDVTVLVFHPAATQASPSPQQHQQLRQVLLASEATWDGEQWHLREGRSHIYGSDGLTSSEHPFTDLALPVAADLATLMQPAVTPGELTLPQLTARLRFLAQSNVRGKEWLTEWYSRFSVPLACFFAVFVSLPLSVQASRQIGRYGGVVAGIMMVFFYYLILNLARSLGNAGAVPPWVAAWSHSLVFGSVGVLLSWRFWRR